MDESRITRIVVTGFAAFCLAYLALKLATVSAAHYDYAKEIYNAQALRWVYEAANPPLYTWILHGVSRLFGPSVATVLVLNHALLFAILLAAFGLGRRIFGGALDGAFAAGLLLTLHQVYRFQFARTHSLLLVLCALLALLTFMAILRERQTRDYVLLGLALGAGLLSKFNFAFFVVTLLVGAVMVREGRRALADWRIALSLLALLAVFLPVALAGIDRWAALAEIFRFKTASVARPGGAETGFAALPQLAGALVAFVAVPVLAAGWAVAVARIGRKPILSAGSEAAGDEGARRVLSAMLLVGLLILVAGVLFDIVDRVSGRHLLAFLLPLPFVMTGVARRYAPELARLRRAWLGIAAVLIVQVLVRVLDLSPYCSGKCSDLQPYDRMAMRLGALGVKDAAIITDDISLGGNLVAALPGSAVTVAGVRRIVRPLSPSRARCLFIWRVKPGRPRQSSEAPRLLINATGLAWRAALDKAQMLTVSWRWRSRDRFSPFASGSRRSWTGGYILLRRGEGACR